jgi:isochorismate hydrolase
LESRQSRCRCQEIEVILKEKNLQPKESTVFSCNQVNDDDIELTDETENHYKTLTLRQQSQNKGRHQILLCGFYCAKGQWKNRIIWVHFV